MDTLLVGMPVVCTDKEEYGDDGRLTTFWGTAQIAGELKAKKEFDCVFRCASSGPFALVLDDLQWGICPSLELLETLIKDRQNTALKFIMMCCYRSIRVDESHRLFKMIQDNNTGREHDISRNQL